MNESDRANVIAYRTQTALNTLKEHAGDYADFYDNSREEILAIRPHAEELMNKVIELIEKK